MKENLPELRYLVDIEKTLDSVLTNEEKNQLRIKVSRYKQYTEGKIDKVAFQKRAVESALRSPRGMWCGELGTGSVGNGTSARSFSVR